MHASGCGATKHMRLRAGMPKLQGRTIRIESSTKEDDQNDGYRINKHEVCAQNKENQGINSGQNILPAIKSQHVRPMHTKLSHPINSGHHVRPANHHLRIESPPKSESGRENERNNCRLKEYQPVTFASLCINSEPHL